MIRKGEHKLLCTEEELAVVPDILNLLKHFLDITLVMSKENILTINLIVPYTGLIQLLEIATPITEVGKEFCKALLGKAQKRLLYYEETSIARYDYCILLYVIL